MAYYIYILECKDGSYYTGITWSISKRTNEHNKGLSLSTKGKLPVKLVYWEEFSDNHKAAIREKEIKGWSRIKKIKLISSKQKVYTETIK